MLIVNVFIAGGVMYAGVKTLIKRRPRKAPWLTDPIRQKAQASRSETDTTSFSDGATSAAETGGFEESPGQSETGLRRNLAISSVSVGLSAAGALVYSPLGLVSVPMTIYSSIPIFERAYEAIFRNGQGKITVVSSLAVISTLATRNYFWASLIDWLYHYLTLLGRRMRDFNEYLSQEFTNNYYQFLRYRFGGRPQSVWRLVGGTELEIPFDELTIGDVVAVNEGEVVPTDGHIVEGHASANLFFVTRNPDVVEIREGDHVSALTMVRSGRICVRVEKL